MKKLSVGLSLSGKYNSNIYIQFKIILLQGLIFFSFFTGHTQNIVIRNFSPDSKAGLNNEAAIVRYLLQQYPELNNQSSALELVSFPKSPYAQYYSFKQTFENIRIENSIIKVSADNSGNIISIMGNYFNTQRWNITVNAEQKFNLPELFRSELNLTDEIVSRQIILTDENNNPEIYFEFDQQSKKDRSRITLLFDTNGQLIEKNDHKVYYSGVDSTVVGNVFLPDPLTTEGTTYGGDYSDNDDNDNDALMAEQFLVEFKANFENDTFFLRTNNVVLKDLNSPSTGVVTSLTPEFIFTRSDDGFEDVNTFYHITNFNNYIISKGYSMLQDFYIEIDPHGASGADQSFYVSAIVPSIQYGEGGVDDAEDADVILHEYGHAISDHASPGSNVGLERHAIGEGYSDYFAVSYSRMFSDFNWHNVFSWDGHNEFWFGRNANTNKHYPEDNSDNIYAASEIWSGALMDIYDVIGKENMDMLVMEALYASFINMTMPDAAQIILNSENILFGGIYYDIVYDLLDNRGLINPVGNDEIFSDFNIRFNNSYGFALNNEPLVIEMPAVEKYELTVYTIEGKTILFKSGIEKFIEISPILFNNGLFIITINTDKGIYSKEIIKL